MLKDNGVINISMNHDDNTNSNIMPFPKDEEVLSKSANAIMEYEIDDCEVHTNIIDDWTDDNSRTLRNIKSLPKSSLIFNCGASSESACYGIHESSMTSNANNAAMATINTLTLIYNNTNHK